MNTDNCLEITQDILDKFEYCEKSPTGLIWKIWNRAYGPSSRQPGDPAGAYQFMRGEVPHCLRVGVNRKLYLVHRIIWTLLKGPIQSGYIIDHIDGNPFNNQIENLRELYSPNNSQNAKKRSDNSTGHTGIFLLESKIGTQHYLASWRENNIPKTKSFNIGVLGEATALQLAIQHRASRLQGLNANGATYTERHGK